MLADAITSSAELTDVEFGKISRLVYELCGIHLSDGKKELVKARLGKRMRNGQFKSFRDYYDFVVNESSGQELVYLIDSISTNFTSFFREGQHFDYLRSELLPDMMERKRSQGSTLRLWSAGCSSGEEAYSIAITLLEGVEDHSNWDIKILGTDISTRVLRIAESGIYHKERIQPLPTPLVKKYFLKGEGYWKDYVKVKDRIKQYIQFKRLNFMEPFKFKEPFDCIFCRNVMIYFDKNTQTDLVNRFYDCLETGGGLFIGHAESLTGIKHSFHYVKPAIYRKGER